MKTELKVMLSLQDKMNKKVHPDWVAQDFAWFRAAWIECAELIEHYGYKWWKKQQPDMAQVQLEVVDIWHFGLSMMFDGRTVTEIAEDIEMALNTDSVEQLGVIEASEALAESLLAGKTFHVSKFWALMIATEMNFDDLFRQYVGKNVLNFFRQDHGYKTGEYKKQWFGREDNEHLSDILLQIKEVDDQLPETIYNKLNSIYVTL